MSDQPIFDDRIIEAIESCRPGSNDLSDPALAFLAEELAANPDLNNLYQRMQELDGTLADVFQDVPVPENLQDRILALLPATRPEKADSTDAPPAPVSHRQKKPVPRRFWIVSAGVAAVAASVLIAAFVHLQTTEDYTGADVRQLAIRYFHGDTFEGGELLAEKAPPKAYPPGRHVVRIPRMRWRRVSDFLGRPGVAYDLPGPGNARATLYVVKYKVADPLPATPPLRPALTTRGYSTSAWQAGPLLYVLVVQGESRTYRGFLNLPRVPLT